VTLGVVHSRKPGKRCKMPHKLGISPRFFLGRLKSVQPAFAETSIVAAIQCGFSRQALSQSALKLTRKSPSIGGFFSGQGSSNELWTPEHVGEIDTTRISNLTHWIRIETGDKTNSKSQARCRQALIQECISPLPPRSWLFADVECGGKRSATPLWYWGPRRVSQSAVAAPLCRRTP
jgi:hypothetical protein